MTENNINFTERHLRDFGSHEIYLPKKYNDFSSHLSYTGDSEENRFRFKNSLIITPNYEVEFNGTGGIKYIKNHDDCVFFNGGGIFAITNNIQKLPVMLKREISKISTQKKLVVAEKYNYEEKYEVHQNIILYYEENRIDFQVSFVKNIDNETKDITTEFGLNFYFPELYGSSIEYKKFSGADEYKEEKEDIDMLENIEYIILNCGKICGMTIYPEKTQTVVCKNKSMYFTVPNPPEAETNQINIKYYLEKYRIV
jgi:hypothetical protein